MKRTLVAAVLCAGLAAAGGAANAQTNVRLYGLVDGFVGHVTNSVDSRGSATIVDSGGMSTSFFGMSGTEELGNGLKAVFALEAFYRVDTGGFGRFGGTADLGFRRSAWVGLAGNFGQVTLGRNTAPYFLATVFFNPYGDSFVFSPLIAHSWRAGQTDGVGVPQNIVQGDTGLSNSLRWTSASFGGLRADIAVSASAFDSENFNDPKSYGRAADIALFYNNGPISAGAVYRAIDLDAKGATPALRALDRDQRAFLVGGSYDFRVAKAFASYQEVRDDFVVGDDAKKRNLQLGVSVPVGPGLVLASYARSNYERSGVNDNSRDTFAIGYDYLLSRRTDLYATWYRDRIKGDDTAAAAQLNNAQNVFGVGLRHRF